MRNRSWRRKQTERIQKRRLRDLLSTFWTRFKEMAQPRHFGHLRKDHYGCGCQMCKPHRFRGESGYKISEKKKLIVDKDE